MKPFRSLRWQIQSWHSILLVLIVGGMLTAFYYYERQVKVHLLDAKLWTPVHAVLPVFRVTPGDLGLDEFEAEGMGGHVLLYDSLKRRRQGRGAKRDENGGGQLRRAFDGVRSGVNADKINYDNLKFDGHPNLGRVEAEGYYVKSWIGLRAVYTTEGAPAHIPKPESAPGLDIRHGVNARWNGGNREMIQPTPIGYVLIGVSSDVIEADLAAFRNKLIMIGLGIVSVGFIGGWWISRRAMQPISTMSETAVKISSGDLSQRIDGSHVENELSDLAGVLNHSFEKLEQSFSQQVRFSADASHEMRTPLAVILAKTELALARERSPEKYQETIQTCYDSAHHMSSLVESLLALSKVDSGEFQVTPQLGQLSILVDDCVQLLAPLADQREISISTNLHDVRCNFDEQRLRQVVINLLSNAIKYNSERGELHVSMEKGEGVVQIKVRDTGPGMSEKDAEHVFDRFYKVDDSRASEKGSTGLGLAISKAIVEAHGGSLIVESKLGSGSAFIVELPT